MKQYDRVQEGAAPALAAPLRSREAPQEEKPEHWKCPACGSYHPSITHVTCWRCRKRLDELDKENGR